MILEALNITLPVEGTSDRRAAEMGGTDKRDEQAGRAGGTGRALRVPPKPRKALRSNSF